ncbi:hypothetical protein NLJ89_g1498 [Agrocybe chaxingu]|uniref:Uncharacterized protein n=1 Tax=Agrocybe chaxingu TaxID=84603 RepID=A0A9W8MZZ2_9AGAR|nr:hypothetical protein NLJ89_g1498 [Agrocybe chaxingu]
MEEDEETPKSIPPWVELEYAHMRILAGSTSQVRFTHLSTSSCESINSIFTGSSSSNAGLSAFSCHQQGVVGLMKELGVPIDQVCLLDPKAEKELSPEDGGRPVSVVSGILGDDPPRDRTSELRVHGFPTRHLGPIQMTTDTALGVTKIVVHDRVPLQDIPYIDYPTIRFNAKESVEMPFRYIADGKEPCLPPGMKELLYEDLNKGFDF